MPSFPSRLITIALLLFVAACNRQVTPPPRTTPAPRPSSPPGGALVLFPSSWSGGVTVTRSDSIILALPNGRREIERRTRVAQFTLSIGPTGTFSLKLDSLSYTPTLPIQRNSVGTEWDGQIDAKGRVTSLSMSRHSGMTDDLQRAVLDMLPRMPRTGVTAGINWRDTAERSVFVDLYDTDEQRTATWTVGERTSRDALVLTPVQVSESFEQLGKGSVAGRATSMSAQGTRRGTWYVTLLGQPINATLVDSTAKLVTISGTRDPISTIEISRTTIRFANR